jgi:hypothetical protein
VVVTASARRLLAGVVIAVCMGCVLLAGLFYLIRRNACSSEALQVVNLSGVRIEVEGSSCDLIAKDEAVNVYAMRASEKETWPSSNWSRHRTLIFSYDPGRDDNPLPSITRSSQSAILIAIPEVSSIRVQNHEWESLSISYEIGKVYYPTKSN